MDDSNNGLLLASPCGSAKLNWIPSRALWVCFKNTHVSHKISISLDGGVFIICPGIRDTSSLCQHPSPIAISRIITEAPLALLLPLTLHKCAVSALFVG